MDIILLKLQTFGLLGGITGLVIGHSGQRLGILVGSALEEVPSVCALVHGGEILKNRVVVIAGLELESRSRLNDYCELTGIPCIVLVTGDLEADLIAAFYGNLVKAEIQDVVVAVSLEDFDFLFKQNIVVLINSYGHAVRIIGVLVLVSVFDVGAEDINIAVLGNDPRINGILRSAGVHEIFLHGQSVCPSGRVFGFILAQLCEKLSCARLIAFQEIPSVCALLHGRDLAEDRLIVIAGLHLDSRSRLNNNGELAAVPCIVVVCRNLEGQSVASFDRELREVKIKNVIISVAALYFDLLGKKDLAVQADRERYTIGQGRIGILLTVLDVGPGYVDLSVLTYDPQIDRILDGAGMNEILAHLKAFRAS